MRIRWPWPRQSAPPPVTPLREPGPGHVALLWLIGAMTLATLPFVGALPPWLPFVLAGIAIWRWRRERRGQPPPSAQARILISGLVIGGLALSGSIGLGLEAAVPLFVAFLWIKLLELRGERDVLMGCYLSCFLASANLLLDQGVLRTVYAVATIVATIAAALRFHLARGGGAPPAGAVWRKAGVIALQGVPAAVLLFLLLPRPLVNLPLDRGQARTGLSDRLKPGEIANLALNQEAAFRVTLPDGPPRDPESMYWRGLVLTETDGSGWYRNRTPAVLRNEPRAAPGVADDPEVVQEITLLPHNRHWLYALDCPVDLPEGTKAYLGVVLFRDEPVQNPLTYRAVSRVNHSPTEMPFGYRRTTLATPVETPATVSALARLWRERAALAGDPGARGTAAAGLAWFAEQGFTYSLEPGVIEGDLVAGFLERRKGFCGHYSAAFTVLMRLAGFPARVVIGYRGGEWNEPGGFLVVRQAHAHAWAEIWIEEEQRWLRIDPTSAVTGDETRRIASEGAQAINDGGEGGRTGWGRTWRRGRQWWDWVNATWENTMFRFDASAQQRLRERLGLGGLGTLGATMVALGAALGAVVVLAVLLRRRRPRRDPARVLYDRWCRGLPGCVCGADEGPLAFAARARLALPARAAEIDTVTAAYVAARYASPGPDALADLRAALRAPRSQSQPDS